MNIKKHTQELIINLGVEVDTHQDGDAFIKTYTFNDAQLDSFIDEVTEAVQDEYESDLNEITKQNAELHMKLVTEKESYAQGYNDGAREQLEVTEKADLKEKLQ